MKLDFTSYDLIEQYANEAQYGVANAFQPTVRDIHDVSNQPSSAHMVDEHGLYDWKEAAPTTRLNVENLTTTLPSFEPVYAGDSTPEDRLLRFKSTVISGAMVPKTILTDARVVSLSSSIQTMPAPIIELSGINLNGGMHYEATRFRATDLTYDLNGNSLSGMPLFRCIQPGSAIQKIVVMQKQPFTYAVDTDPQCVPLSADYFTQLGIGFGPHETSTSNALQSITGYVAPFYSIYSTSAQLLNLTYGPLLSGNYVDYISRTSLTGNSPVTYDIKTLTNLENGEIGVHQQSDSSRAIFNRVYVETDPDPVDSNSVHPMAFVDKGYHTVGNGRNFVARLSYENDSLKFGFIKELNAGVIYKITFRLFWDDDTHEIEIFTTKDGGPEIRNGDVYFKILNKGVKDKNDAWLITGPHENPPTNTIYDARVWHTIEITNQLSSAQTVFNVKIDGNNFVMAENWSGASMPSEIFDRVIIRQQVSTDYIMNRVYVDDFQVFFCPNISTFDSNHSWRSQLAPRIQETAPRLYNLNPTADNEGVLDVFFFYDDFDLDNMTGAKATYLGGLHDKKTLNLVSKYTYDTGTSCYQKGSLILQRSQADCFSFGEKAWLVHGSSHAETTHYHAAYAQFLEVYDSSVDTTSMWLNNIWSLGNYCHSFRNAFANTELFGLAYMGFLNGNDSSVDNPMWQCYYVEDYGYPKGGAPLPLPDPGFPRKVRYKIKRPTSTVEMTTLFGADSYNGFYAGACLNITKPSEKAAYLFGGREPSNYGTVRDSNFTKEIRLVDLVDDTFTTVETADMVRKVEGCMAVNESENIWIAGGVRSYENTSPGKYGIPLNLIWKFDTTNETNEVLPAKLPRGRGFGVATTNMSETKMHVAGGGDLNYNHWFDSESISIIDFATGTECVRCESTLGINRVGHMGASI